LDGIKIDRSDEDENADDSIRVNCEFDSSEIDESHSQYEKHFEQRISGLHGIKIDRSSARENVSDSRRAHRAFDSNAIVEYALSPFPFHPDQNLSNRSEQTFTINVIVKQSRSDPSHCSSEASRHSLAGPEETSSPPPLRSNS
jgi:hypothetical protein